MEKYLSLNDIGDLGNYAADILNTEIDAAFLSDFGNLRTRLIKDMTIINTIIVNRGKIDETLEQQLMLQLFKDIVALRTFFTGQQYMLAIGSRNNTYKVPLQDLFERERIIVNDGQLNYSVKNILKTFDQIKGYNESLKKLNNSIFTTTISTAYGNFIYSHRSSKTPNDEGGFWKPGFAAYKKRAIQHYYVEKQYRGTTFYTADTATYYNRGHVYEKFLSDINIRSEGKNYNPDPYRFMDELVKDRVPFIQGGDYKMSKGGIIYAVQVKKINNKKLISYTQIQSTLKTLQVITSEKVSKTAFKKAVKEAFISQEKGINRGAASQVDENVDKLFKSWGNIQI